MQENKNSTLQNNELPLDVYSILRTLVREWWMIITAGLVGAMLAYMLIAYTYTPTYTSSMTFIVSSKGSTNSNSDLRAAYEMAETFSEVLDSRLLKKRVQEELNLDYLPGTITTNVVQGTNLMSLSVTAESPEHAFRIMKSVLNNYTEITQHVLENVVLDVMEAPMVPLEPSNPIFPGWVMLKYMLVGMAAMVLLLALQDYLKDDIKNESEVEQKLDTKLLGTIYHETKNKTLKTKLKKNKKGLLITDPTVSFMFVENYKKLRTKIMYRTKQESGNVILVTSVGENEGKSTVATNLALALAQKSDKVVLIDGDMRRPSAYKLLEQKVEKKQELGEYLKGKNSVRDVFHFDKEHGIYLMIGSKHYANSTEMVSGECLRNLIKTLQNKADYIVIDSPPVSLMADAEILAEYSDVSLLVVRQGAASARYINDTIDILDNGHSELLGCVYNDVKTRVFSGKRVFGTYGGYKYGYGRYGRYGYGRYGYGKYGYGKYDQPEQIRYQKPQPEVPVEELELYEESV